MTRARVLLATIIAIAALAGPATSPALRAATPDLTLVSHALYEVQPGLRRIRVTLDITATNRLRDTVTRRFFFDRAYLAVLPGSRGFRITSTVGTPSVRVVRQNRDQTLLLLSFGRRLTAGRSAVFQLRFDLPDPGGAPTRNVRVGSALVSFPVWAFASNQTPGSRVTIRFPRGFAVRTEAGDLSAPVTDAAGQTTLRSGTIASPLRFYAFLVADRPGSYSERTRSIVIGDESAQLVIRAWPDDTAWATRVGGLFTRALPMLADQTGLSWTRNEPLVVQEAVSRTTGGYAGLFDPQVGRVEVAYYATPLVVLHEAAHTWFNGSLLADRWANEGFASHYALATARRLEVPARAVRLTPAMRAAAIPLNAWEAIGRGPTATEEYGYAASHGLAWSIAQRAGDEGLREVWRAAATREVPYGPEDGQPDLTLAAELGDEPPDWRGLLDLLEERTGQRYDDLWAAWVVRPEEAGLLAERRVALDDYRRTTVAADGWLLPRPVRDALRAWRFDDARELLADARGVLAQRDALEAAARAAGLRLPPTVETLFQGPEGFVAASTEATAELRTIEAFQTALAARPRAPDAFQQVGLIGLRPGTSIAAASAAFERGDLVTAVRESADAQALWESASEIGRDRVLSGLGIALLVGLAIVWMLARVVRLRRRRRRRLARMQMAHRP